MNTSAHSHLSMPYHSVIARFICEDGIFGSRLLRRSGAEVVVDRDIGVYGRTLRLISEFLDHEQRPWLLLNGDTPLLNVLVATEAERARIRRDGLCVFMFEPLFINDLKGDHPKRVFDFENSPVTFEEQVGLVCNELDSVLTFLNANHIFAARVKIYLCDVGLGEVLKQIPRYSFFDFETLDVFLLSEAIFHKKSPEKYRAERPIEKRFACLNYRYEAFRECTVGFLRYRGYHKDAFVSYFHSHDEHTFQYHLRMPAEDFQRLEYWKEVSGGIALMQPELPYFADDGIGNPQILDPLCHRNASGPGGINVITTEGALNLYARSFVALAPETRFFHCHGSISEKITLPICAFRPFVVIGSPHLLHYLRDLGFKTFHDFWDETYDSIIDPVRRLDAIFELIDKLATLSNREMEDMLHKMRPVLEHNAQFFTNGLLERQLRRLNQ